MARKRGRPEGEARELETAQVSTKKRKREYTEADASLAKTFERLASEIEKERIKAAAEIVNLYKTSRSSSEKILSRLIRGLCSSRKAARPGFFIALTEVLKVTRDKPDILDKQTFDEALIFLLEKLKSETKIEGVVSSQEKRDYHFGRLTGYSALVHSFVLLADEFKSYLDLILQEVWEISRRVSWLTEQCGKVYFDIVTIATSHGKKELINDLLKFLMEKNLFKTPEGIAVWLEASKSTVDVQFPEHVWNQRDPLALKELHLLAKIMRDGVHKDSEEIGQVGKHGLGNRRDTPHFAWNTILARYFGETKQDGQATGDAGTSGTFEHFWLTVVDNVYFASGASAERKALGFRIFSMVISVGPSWGCEQAMSPRLMNCVMNQRSKDDRFLNQAATSLLNKLKLRATSEQALARKILSAMIRRNPDRPEKADADRIGRNRSFINEMFEGAEDGVAVAIIDEYEQVLFRPGVEIQSEADNIRRAIADSLLSFVRLRKRTPSETSNSPLSWRNKIFRVLFRCSCLQTDFEDGVVPPITDNSREMFKSRLLSCLKELLNTQDPEDLDLILTAVSELDNYESGSFVEFRRNYRVKESTFEALGILKEIRTMEMNEKQPVVAQLGAFKLLLSMAILQVCCGEIDAISILSDLKECHNTFKNQTKSQLGGFDAVIEIILGFCSNQSALYRTLSEQVFISFASEISSSSLQSLIHVLEQEENLAGQRELFNEHHEEQSPQVNGATDVDDGSTEAKSEDSDVEIVDAASVEGSSENDDISSSAEEGGGGEEEGEEVNEAYEALDRALSEILQTRKPNTANANNTADAGDSSSSDESMDDEQMETLGIDNQLSAIFAQQKSTYGSRSKASEKKREQKDAKQNMLNFKNRVLDLLMIYLKQQHASPTALGVLEPLLRTIGRTRSPQIAKKSSDVLDAYFKAAKTKGMPLSAPSVDVWDILKQVHKEILVFPSKLHASVCSRCSLFLARLLILQKEEGAMGKIIRLYADTHEQRFETTSKAPAAFWTDFVNWSMSMSMGGEK